MMDPRRLADAPSARQTAFLVEAVAANTVVMTVLERAAAMALPDHGLMAGAVYQAVWNALTGRDPAYGVNDYDLGYFDATDLGEAAEDIVIRAGAAVFADVDAIVEIRNQARVHLWFGAKHGVTRAPLTSTSDAVANFASHTHAVAVRLDAAGAMEVLAPFGLAELFSLQVRPVTALADPSGWNAKCLRQQALWPEVCFESVAIA
ncbi:nucleotidyltransferase family protein [uncultured Maricaulis sp.]|uniref:nucleotidyltransferase family protein n=1 Tax=uncultured Maricaulis sp. TaxID=174710 RepID=UPI0030D7F079|tara:strand:- start:6907 stop:7521 length:615 start_codon:yes stop_codon:yes gene_type:complete